MDLRSIYVANAVGVVLMLILLYVSRTRTSGRRVEGGLLIFMVLGIMLGCCMEMLAYAVDGRLFPGARLINYIANTCLYTINLLLPFCLMVYIDLGLYDDLGRIRKKYKVQLVVGCVMLAANLLNRAHCIFVDRHATDMNAMRNCMKAIKMKKILLIFPEGTRHHEGQMEQIETGTALIAMRTKAPIIPIYIDRKLKIGRAHV